jgi:hypothetical protein
MSDIWSRTELKKCGLRQSKDGVIISFVLHPSDVTNLLVQAPIGTVYLAALVEQNPQAVREEPKIDHRLSKQAAICCEDPRFHKFLQEEYPHLAVVDPNDPENHQAPDVVREICGVDSRSEFDTDPRAANAWQYLHGRYLAWLQA